MELKKTEQLVAHRAGLQLRPQERETLRTMVHERLRTLKLSDVEAYNLLLQGSGGPQKAQHEWDFLFARLTNNESYFFRDAGQLALLEEKILPGLIESNRSTRTLRLWSAGCSTGEEPYSLAMLIDELLPASERASWSVLILGTDLSEAALSKARRGVYGPWSFRTLSPARRERYFHRSDPVRGLARSMSSGPRDTGDWELVPRIRSAVTLRAGNLALDDFPSAQSEIREMDLIVCRNVFIYFERDAIRSTLEKFSRTLRPGGYLLTGHTELHDAPPQSLRTLAFPQTIIYQRPDASTSAISSIFTPTAAPHRTPAPASPAPAPTPRAPAPRTQLPPAPEVPGIGASGVPQVLPMPGHTPQVLEVRAEAVLLERAHLEADAGRYEAARELCQRALASDSLAVEPLHLLARIALEQNDHEAAKSAWKKVIYLEPSLVWPYLEMDALYRREGDVTRARTMRQAALGVLAALAPDAPVSDLSSQQSTGSSSEPPATARQIIEHLKAIA